MVMTNSLHKSFINKFYRFFRIKKINGECYHWGDPDYKDFMLNVLFSLEPRYYKKHERLIEELSQVEELNFVSMGKIGIGFHINQEVKWCLKL